MLKIFGFGYIIKIIFAYLAFKINVGSTTGSKQ